jgi:hypothetical protein
MFTSFELEMFEQSRTRHLVSFVLISRKAPFTRQHVMSVVMGDDIISRFELATFRELQRALMVLSSDDTDTNDDNDTNNATMPPLTIENGDGSIDEEGLYCCWWYARIDARCFSC